MEWNHVFYPQKDDYINVKPSNLFLQASRMPASPTRIHNVVEDLLLLSTMVAAVAWMTLNGIVRYFMCNVGVKIENESVGDANFK